MIIIKTLEEIEKLREGGKRLANILHHVADMVVPGVSTNDLDEEARRLSLAEGDTPAFLNYTPVGARRPYPASLCVSINDEIVHGIPNENPKIVQEGDVVSLDMGIIHEGLITDSAVTVIAGVGDKAAQALLSVTQDALYKGIDAARAGNRIGEISFAIEQCAMRHHYGVFEELGGHGVGRYVHEDPHIPNFGPRSQGPRLKSGMVIAIEPMFSEGSKELYLDKDGYTFKTKDKSRAAHFEHTILITEGAPEIVTSFVS